MSTRRRASSSRVRSARVARSTTPATYARLFATAKPAHTVAAATKGKTVVLPPRAGNGAKATLRASRLTRVTVPRRTARRQLPVVATV